MARRQHLLLLSMVVIFVAMGCSLRSISDSGYDSGRGWGRRDNPFYRGELSEFDVLGIDRGKQVTDQEIREALDARKPLTVKRGSSIMLIQSGAPFPDDPMTKALEKYYAVGTFTGVPSAPSATESTTSSANGTAESYSRALRLAAARGGYETLVVYWGILEAGQENLATKTVSWVPVVGWLTPDEAQKMRIKLKFAVIDVRSGQWDMFTPEPFDDKAYSSLVGRREADQAQVAVLKEKAYAAAAEDLVKRYGR